MAEPAVGILGFGARLGLRPGAFPLDRLEWPLGQPDRLRGGALRDLATTDHLILPVRRTVYLRAGYGTRARVSPLIMEPRAIHERHARAMRWAYRRFFRVLTYYPDLLDDLPNAAFVPFGHTWVPDWRDLEIDKTALVSLIASAKRDLEGHRLRHAIVDWARAQGQPLEAVGGGYRPFGDKSEGLAPYRFSVVIENVREQNYFSEKLIDAILCEAVPIYWGCPNIGDFLDTSAMIVCETEAELRAAVAAATPERYAQMLPSLRGLKDRADYWGRTFERAAEAVLG